MKLNGPKEFPDLSPGDSEIIGVNLDAYLAKKTSVTVSSLAWASDPQGLTFSSQSDTSTGGTVKVTVPDPANTKYNVEITATLSDGAVRKICAPLKVVCP